MKKDDFKFINEPTEEFFIEEKVVLDKVEKEVTKEALEKEKRAKRKRIIKKYTTAFIVTFTISAVLFVFGLSWQDDFSSLMAIGDALWLVFALWLTVAWVVLVYNQNLFSPLLHGTKTFLLMFVGKKPKEDYYTYMKKIEENPIPKFIIIVSWITTLFVFLLALTTLIMIYA
ncbi:MAG: hypothetical protein WCZ19_00805 [Acholeplasma sp.]